MSQLALGLRSLLIRLAVFFVLAATLAWVLGGTLFPSSQSVTFPPFIVGAETYAWRVTGHAQEARPVAWTLVRMTAEGARPVAVDVAGPWIRTWGPNVHAGGALLGIESGAPGDAAGLWVVSLSADGSTGARKVSDEGELLGTLRVPPGSSANGS